MGTLPLRPGGAHQSRAENLLPEISPIEVETEENLVDLLELRHRELVRKQAVGDVGVGDLRPYALERDARNLVVVVKLEGEALKLETTWHRHT